MGQSRDSKEVLLGEEDKKRGGKDLRGEEAVLETQSKEKGEKFLQAGATTTTTASSLPTAEKTVSFHLLLTTILFLHAIGDIV